MKSPAAQLKPDHENAARVADSSFSARSWSLAWAAFFEVEYMIDRLDQFFP